MTAAPTGLVERISAVLALDHTASAIEFGGEWYSWGQLASTVDLVAALVPEPGAEIGVLLRNDPAVVGLVLGIVKAGGCVVTVNPRLGPERVRDDLASLGLTCVVGLREDIAGCVPDDAEYSVGAIDSLGGELSVTRRDASGGSRAGVAVRMLTSGTTGPPKRVDLTYESFERVLVGAKHYESTKLSRPELRRGVAVVNAPLTHLGGLFRILQCVCDGRSFVLLEGFDVDTWVDAVRRHRPKTASLVPAALRMVLDANIDPAHLASLKSVISGTAPLDPADADAFYTRFGVPVLIAYAATEFAGGVAGWTIADHAEYWATKKGSVGRAHPGCELRVVDPDDGTVLDPGVEGVLEVKAEQLPGQGWIRTTDLSRLDEDGFLWIVGRADQAIIRGGFKVIPDTVKAALERHGSVQGAAVVALDDRRLGSVPVAAVELRPDSVADAAELEAFVAESLNPYEVPAEVIVVDELPRTDSGKADLRAVAALFSTTKGETS